MSKIKITELTKQMERMYLANKRLEFSVSKNEKELLQARSLNKQIHSRNLENEARVSLLNKKLNLVRERLKFEQQTSNTLIFIIVLGIALAGYVAA